MDGEVEGFPFCDGEVDGPSKCPSRCPSRCPRQNKAYFNEIRLILDEIRLISSKEALFCRDGHLDGHFDGPSTSPSTFPSNSPS